MNNMQKILTVSVAAYNVEACLAEALDSCMAKDLEGLEVIVVNDGSGDGSLQIAREYERRHPGLFRVVDKENGGYGSTINASLALARGKYFRYLDGDDWFDKDGLEGLLNRLASTDVDAIYSPVVRVFTETGTEVQEDRFAFLGTEDVVIPIERLPSEVSPLACSMTYRTDLLREIGFLMSERLFYSDTEFAVEPLVAAKDILITHDALYRYRIGREGQSISLDGRTRHYPDALRVVRGILDKMASAWHQHPTVGATSLLLETVLSGYTGVLLAKPSKEAKAALVEFDAWLRDYPDFYAASAAESGAISLLRKTNFLAYMPLSLRARSKEKKRQSQCR